MNDLIPISESKTCLASDLHRLLKTGVSFDKWAETYLRNDRMFAEGLDYWAILGNTNYELTIVCGKEIVKLHSDTGLLNEATARFLKAEALLNRMVTENEYGKDCLF